MMVVAWKMSLSVKSPFEWKKKTQTKFQPFGVELLACRDRIEFESSDLSISSRNNCFLRDNRSCKAHGPREFAMKKAAAEDASSH